MYQGANVTINTSPIHGVNIMYISFYNNPTTGHVKTLFSTTRCGELIHRVDPEMKTLPNLQLIEAEGTTENFTDSDARLAVARVLWQSLSDVPVCNTHDVESLEEPFLHFNSGALVHDVWHWFENEFDLSIGKDLL